MCFSRRQASLPFTRGVDYGGEEVPNLDPGLRMETNGKGKLEKKKKTRKERKKKDILKKIVKSSTSVSIMPRRTAISDGD